MKKKYFYSLLATFSVLLINSCGEIEHPPKYLEINGERIELKDAYVTDWGTNTDITFRSYELSFESGEEVDPRHYISFDLNSYSTTRINEGVYSWGNDNMTGEIHNILIGYNLEYDDFGVAIAGTRFDENYAVFSGTIAVSMKDGDYFFDFDLEAIYKDKTYKIIGEYNDALIEVQ